MSSGRITAELKKRIRSYDDLTEMPGFELDGVEVELYESARLENEKRQKAETDKMMEMVFQMVMPGPGIFVPPPPKNTAQDAKHSQVNRM